MSPSECLPRGGSRAVCNSFLELGGMNEHFAHILMASVERMLTVPKTAKDTWTDSSYSAIPAEGFLAPI